VGVRDGLTSLSLRKHLLALRLAKPLPGRMG
jgi:hypothetical protein